MSYAGFWKRFFAFLFDLIIIYGICFVAGSLMGIILVLTGIATTEADFDQLDGFFQIVTLFIVWLYYSVCESSKMQATPGKKILSIKVTDLDGERISFGRASGRFFGKIISGLIFYIGYIMAAFTEKKQALHDKMASCLVINS